MNHTGPTSIRGQALFTEHDFAFKVADMMMNWRVAMRLYSVRAHCSQWRFECTYVFVVPIYVWQSESYGTEFL